MPNRKADIASINKAILKDPAGASKNELVGLLELEDPDLKFLCPLARAIYFAETGRPTKASSAQALATIWCIDDSFASDTSWTGAQAHVRENVRHEIEVKLDGKVITLGFSASTEMTHYTDFWSEYVRSASADEWKSAKGGSYPEFLEDIFSLLDQESAKGGPQGYPTDSGEFIGTSSYKLVSIGGLPVNGPTFHDSYHEQRWDGLSDEFGEQYNEDDDDEPGGFSWLNCLSKSQAEKLGLAASGDEAIGPDSGYPEWASRNLLEENATVTWVSTDMIYSSYSEGKLQVDHSECAYIAVGCGCDWDPSSNPDEQEELDESLELPEYPEDAAPLFKLEVRRGSSECPKGLSQLLPYFKLFHAELNS
ncbi:hypothetical protein [Synechococcus sp. 8F6]|uniref:hypothetical protein n=1 Tax=Synechococcus sp. 8F6 TaxID=2025606 RepID=UPI00117F619F|nr:hypothetical protein [Synechococcus sp. 8F6]